MIAQITSGQEKFEVDLNSPIEISLPLKAGKNNPSAWNAPDVEINPVRFGDWVGEVKSGAPVNFRNIFFNPHGNGTHTECVGHISLEDYYINDCFKKYFFLADLISISPEDKNLSGRVISAYQIESLLKNSFSEALIIRTLPNEESKKSQNYFEQDPPYLEYKAAELLREKGVKHLLVDLPSVDREKDDGKLLSHHAFWNYPANPRLDSSISEFVFVPNDVPDGRYFINIQIACFENDASPSKILLFKIK